MLLFTLIYRRVHKIWIYTEKCYLLDMTPYSFVEIYLISNYTYSHLSTLHVHRRENLRSRTEVDSLLFHNSQSLFLVISCGCKHTANCAYS
jgi:hypothetical protein